jgi:hypothetical protein
MEQNVQRWKKQKKLLLKEANSPRKAFFCPKQKNLSATERVLEFVLEET